MKKMIQKIFSLSDKGASDLVKSGLINALCSIFVFATSMLIYFVLRDLLIPIISGAEVTYNIAMYALYGGILLAVLMIAYSKEYRAKYPPAYSESASKRIRLAERIRELPLSFFGKKDLTDVTTTLMGDTNQLEQAFSHYMPDLVGSVIATGLISVSLFIYNWKIALALFWVVPIAVLLCTLSKKIQLFLYAANAENNLSYLNKMQECIENIKDIKSNNRKESHLQEIEKRLKVYEKGKMKSEVGVAVFVVAAQLILKLGIASSLYVGIHLLVVGEIDLLMFVMIAIIATRLYEPIAGVLINISAVFSTFKSISRMKEMEQTPSQVGSENFDNEGYDTVFDNVTFSYHDDETVLDGVSFTAKQGQVTALIGPSGGGKSTAIKLAARFWDADSGTVKIGGENISNVDPETLLKNISIVFQDVTLFNNTVMENIRIGHQGATDEEVIEAAKASHCHEFIKKLPNGYQTMIGENGSRLSGGERQRLSIARCLLKDAPIVLLDEATSSLDIQNESLVQEAIARLTRNKTVIVIAHRMRTIAGADNIVLLKEGKVAAQGNHKELIEKSADYKNMVRLQTASLNWAI